MRINQNEPVLVVEDNASTGRVIAACLKSYGFNDVKTAAGGAVALEMLAQGTYGLIISDWHMAPMGGIEFLCRVRSSPEAVHVPFVFLSGDDRPSTIASATYAGADGYLVKPSSPGRLAEELRKVLFGDRGRVWDADIWKQGWRN